MSNLRNGSLFHPIRCTSEQLKDLEIHDGELYFLTDTKQIYIAKNNETIEMCGGTNILYGIRDIAYENDGNPINPEQIFSIEEDLNNEAPMENDLILNKDGCFYKVVSINGDEVNSLRLTLQGSGPSNGGNVTPGGGTTYSLSVSKTNIFSSKATSIPITFTANREKSDEENFIKYICFTFDKALDVINGIMPFYEIEVGENDESYHFNTPHEIDLVSCIDKFDTTVKTVYINTEDLWGNKRSASFAIRLVDLTLEAEYDSILRNTTDTECFYSCKVGGATSGINNKKLIFTITDENGAIKDKSEKPLENITVDSVQHEIDISELDHGTYNVEVVLSAGITGTTRTITSNALTHKLVKFVSSNNTPLFVCVLPDKFQRHTTNNIQCYFASSSTDMHHIQFKMNNNVKGDTVDISPNETGTYPLYFDENLGIYTFTATIIELNLTKTFLIEIVNYAGELPFIDPDDKSLKLYLTPQGKSNSSTTKHLWEDYKKRYSATISNLNYSNSSGWLTDKDNITYLQLNSGGILSFNNYSPFTTDPTKPLSGAKYGKGLTIELDFEISGITDFTAPIMTYYTYNKNTKVKSAGFGLFGDSMVFYSALQNSLTGGLTTTKITENKRIRLTYVLEPNMIETADEYKTYFPMLYTYIDGILSNAVFYNKGDSFENDTASAELIIDSSAAAVKVYGIRVYENALTARQVLNNYTASLPTLMERENKFKTNSVYNDKALIDFDLVKAGTYDLQIPYMVLTGGYQTKEESKWELKENPDSPGLPTGKKDYRMVDVEVIYPNGEKVPYFQGYENYEFKNTFDNGKWITDNFGKKANNGGCIMYAQGTSSMEYPVKNLRLRWKKEEDFFKVRPGLSPVEIICMKADYMESSGSHNTGTANLIDDLYEIARMQTPGQKEFTSEGNDIVTCIKGHPCLIFYSPSGQEKTYEYVGKYNLNLDKATPEPFGFQHNDNLGWLPEGYEYWKVQYADKDSGYKDPFIGQLDPTNGADYIPDQVESKETVLSGQKVNAIHCFEFLDNAVAVCNFLNKKVGNDYIDNSEPNFLFIPSSISASKYKPNTIYYKVGDEYILESSSAFDPSKDYYDKVYTFEDTWYKKFQKVVEGKTKQLPGWALGFESRYPEDRVGFHDADALFPMAKWLNELYCLKTFGKDLSGNPTQEDIAEANQIFKNEYKKYFNEDFLIFYYVVTEALLMADSRVKNMMIATWGPEERTWINRSGETVTDVGYIWYPIFYDMDTMFGLDNTGKDSFKYYDEDTNSDIYNGDEVLWNFVRDNCRLEIGVMYGTLEKLLNTSKDPQTGNWLNSSLIPYYNKNQSTMANEAFYNGDAVYKYLDPARKGYYDGLNGKEIDPGVGPYLYAAQGNRSLARENFIINRLKYLQGKYSSGLFQTSNQVEFRWNFPDASQGYRYQEIQFTTPEEYEPNEYYYFDDNEKVYKKDDSDSAVQGRQYYEYVTDSLLAKSAGSVVPTTDFIFTSLQPCYAGVMLGKNGSIYKEKFDIANKTLSIDVPEGSSANNTEAYLLGLGSLKDLGDLSNKYVQKFVMSGENKLSRLILGNPHKDYYNPYWSSNTSTSNLNLTGCTYLEEFNLQNCSSFKSALDFKSSPLIKKILLTGSSVSKVDLPINGNIEELRLPLTVSQLIIDSHSKLTADKFSIGDYNYGTATKIGESGGQYVNNYNYLTEIAIVDTQIDTYSMLYNAVSLNKYYIKGFSWEITDLNDCQYISTTDELPLVGKTYYVWNNDVAQFESVVFRENETITNWNEDDWDRATEKVPLVNNDGTITTIPILDQMLTKRSYYNKNLSSDSEPSGAKGLEGNIRINLPLYNGSKIQVNEFDLYEKYKSTFPDVKFEFGNNMSINGAYRINFYGSDTWSDSLVPHYSVLSNGQYTLEHLISSDGPNGVALINPTKPSENTLVYPFKHWIVRSSTDERITVGTVIDLAIPEEGEEPNTWLTFCPCGNLDLMPYFEPQTRYYTVTFYNWNREIEKTVENYEFGKPIAQNPESLMYLYRPHVDDTSIEKHSRWGFRGWINEIDYNNLGSGKTPTIIDLYATGIIVSDLKLYPYYIEEDCRTTASSLDFFKFEKIEIALENNNTQILNTISLKPEYYYSLVGSITIPAKDNNNESIQAIGIMRNKYMENSNITKIYLQDGSKEIIIGGYKAADGVSAGFYYLSNLTYLYLPVSLKESLSYLADNSFFYDSKLQKIENFSDLPIKFIGESAFERNSQLILSRLPQTLKEVKTKAFYACESLKIDTFGYTEGTSLTGNDNGLESIGSQAFSGAGKTVNQITVNNSIKPTSFGSLCFEKYGTSDKASNPLSLTDYSGTFNYENLSEYFGTDCEISLSQSQA